MPLWYCAGSTLALCWHSSVTLLVLYSPPTLVLRWYCAGTAAVLLWHCTSAIGLLQFNESTALVLHWYCVALRKYCTASTIVLCWRYGRAMYILVGYWHCAGTISGTALRWHCALELHWPSTRTTQVLFQH